MLNGRSKDSDEFTSISVRGLAVVDFPTENLAFFNDFAVCKILDILDQFNIAILLWKFGFTLMPVLVLEGFHHTGRLEGYLTVSVLVA